MPRILPGTFLLILLASDSIAAQPAVLPFKYTLLIEDHSGSARHYGISVNYRALSFRGESIAKVPGDAASDQVVTQVSNLSGNIVAIAREEASFVGKPEYPPKKPAKSFYFDISSLQLSTDGEATLSIQFKNASEQYRLKYRSGEGLYLEAVYAKYGIVAARIVADFVSLQETEGRYIFQCNPMTTSAFKDGKLLWSSDIPLDGQPEFLDVLDELLFVRTTTQHSFYVMKRTGELVFYDKRAMEGKNPSDEIMALWQRQLKYEPYDLTRRGYYRFIRAVGMLEERQAIPLLIETIDSGRDYEERCAAIAVLEVFNGNSSICLESERYSPSYYSNQIGVERVSSKEARKAERAKWEEIFKEHLKE